MDSKDEKKNILFPVALKNQMRDIARAEPYPFILEILNRGLSDELILFSEKEAEMIVKVARIEMLKAELRFPFWDDSLPRHDQGHEDSFHDINMGIFEKTIYYLGLEYQIK